MSTTIDSKVVEMRFDNRHFESNVSTTMSTLDKLKQKLHLDGATKGLENVGSAAKKVDMSGLGTGIDTVQAKFSAMQVVGVTALANITNSAINTGKRMVKALTLDPITTGFKEYETQINAVQTILANTESKGTTIDQVNAALDELNAYADKTIYNFTEMTRNIGTFTAAGVDLDTSVNAIQGIANLAAVSGSTSQQASTAMYQLSQALSSGTVKLMDWNSVVNAGMGGEVFQNALKETARVHGIAIDDMIKNEGSFRETLKDGWLTSDILTETLSKFTMATEGLTEAEIEANKVKLKSLGYTDEQIEGIFKLGNTATNAATKVKTFTQLWDVLKESAQSGWSQTWKLIVGDFEEAKSLLTPLADTLTGFINKMSDARNRVLQVALDFAKPWEAITEKLGNVKKVIDKVGGATKSLEYFQDVVNRVWRGDFNNRGDNPDRYDLLEAAGYDHRVVQDLVNKGYQYKLTVEDVEASHKKFGLTMEGTTEETEKVVESVSKLTDTQLKNAGLTEEEIRLYRALEKEADRLGISVGELADEMSNVSGRDLLIDSFKNLGDIIVGTGKAIKEAWVEIFDPPSLEELGVRLYGLIRTFNEFTQTLRLTDPETGKLNENGQKLARTFKGIFAALDIVLTVIGGPLKIVFKVITQLLSAFGFNILDVTAFIGDMLVKVRDFIDGALDFSGAFEKIVNPVKKAVKAFKDWISGLKESKDLPRDIAIGIASAFGKAFDAVKNFIKKVPGFFKSIPNFFASMFDGSRALPEWMGVVGETIGHLGNIIREKINKFLSRSEFAGISGDSIAGLINGFKEGASKVWNAAVEMAKNLVQKVKDFLGIHSPSKVFYAIGGFIIAGLIAGLQNGIPDSLGAVKDVFQPMLDWINGIDFGAIFAGVMGIFGAATAYKGVDALNKLATPLEGLGDVFEGTGEVLKKSAKPIAKVIKSTSKVVKSFSKVLNGVAFSIKADAIKTLGETLLMLVAAIAILTFFEPGELWNAVGVVTVLSLILVGLAFAMNKLNSASATIDKGGLNIKGLSSGLAGIGMAILLVAAAVKLLGSMDPEQAKQGFLGLAGLVVAIGLVIAAFGLLVKGKAAENIDKFGKTMSKLAIAFLLMSLVAKILGGMNRGTLVQGTIAIAAFAGIMVGLMAATKLISGSKNVETIGKTLLNIALAIGVMAIVAKALGEMDRDTLIQGGIAIVAFGGILVGLMAATKLINGSKNVDKIGGALFKMALAIGIMAVVTKMLGKMSPTELFQGALAITAFGGIIVGLMAATKLISGSKNVDKIGGAILGVSGAIAIMALTALMLSMISWEGFAKGTIMVTAFAGIIVGLMAATKLVGNDADKISKTIITIAAAIGVLGLIAVLLSLVPTENLVKGILAVSALSLVMAGLIAVTKLAQNCMGNIIALTVAIAVLAGALYLVSTIPVESLIPSAIALGGLMIIMGGVLSLLTSLGPLGMEALKTVGVFAALTGVLALIGLVLAMMTALGVQDALPNAAALSILLLSMSAVCVIMSVIPIPAAVSGALGLAAFVGIMAGVLLILGGLSKIPGFNELIADGGTTLSLIGNALGAFVGSIIAGFAGAVLTILPALGQALSGFMTGVQPFIEGAKTIDISVLSGIGILSAAIIALTAADLIAGVTSFLTGGSSFADLGTQLSQFMLNALPFITMAAMITPEMLSGVKALAETILILTAANVLEGLTSWLTGGSSLENFAAQLPILGQGLAAFSASLGTFTEEQLATVNCAAQAVKTLASAAAEIPNTGGLLASIVGENDLGVFATQFPILGSGLAQFLTNIGTFTEEQVATVNCAAQAIKTLAQASSEIPNSGGWLGQIVGENDLGVFAAQFPILGTGLAQFLTNVGTFTDEQVATVECAAKAIKTLAQASSEIPNSGGWLGQIVGENDLGTFASNFPKLGEGLAGFVDKVGTFSDDQVSTVNCAANAVKTLASVASNIPNEGGWLSKIVGDNNLGTFASNFPKLGEGLKGFVDKLGTFTQQQVSTVTAGVNAINALSKLANADLKGASKNIGGFSNKLPDLGEDLSSFCTKMPSTASTTSAVSNLNKILSAVDSIADANSGCLATFATNLKKVGEEAVKKFVGAFTSSSAKTDLKDAAKKLAGKAPEGAKEKKSAMESAGKDLGAGLVKGINAKKQAAYDAGYALGQKAVQGEKDGQKSNSPSKLTIQAGKWLGEGLVIGIGKMGGQVYKAGHTLGETATESLSSSISRISDLVSSDIDSQPTIRPVLDLSDVKSGASALSGMFNSGSIGVSANLGAITSMMSARGQNGGNADVVSELAKLRKDMNSMERVTYSVNGINVTEGSDAAEAISTLVRAIKMEGRA